MTADPDGKWYAKDEADARIEELEKRVAMLADQVVIRGRRMFELEAERDAARADAERYRWIRSDKCYWVSIQAQPYGDEIYKGGPFDALDAAIDAAIDAARGAA
jgi:hypothetical protein